MADVISPVSGSTAGISGAGAGSAGVTTDQGVSPGAAGGSGSGDPGPTKISFALDEGGENTEFQLDEGTPDTPESRGFKFDQLDPLREGEHAELYKTLKAELSAKTRYAKHFKSPEELSCHMERLDRITSFIGTRADGKTGLDAVESTVQELGSVLGKLQSGDPGIVEKWFKDNPSGMAEFTQHAISHLQKTDPKLYDALTSKAAGDFLMQKDASGQSAVDALNALYATVPVDNPQMKALLERVAHSVNELYGKAAYKPDQTNIITRQKTEVAAREQRVWNQETDLQAGDILRPAAGKALSALLTQLKRDATPEERSEFRNALIADFYKEAGKDSAFVSRLNELRKNNDRQGILDLVRTNRAKFLQAAARNLYRGKLLNRAAVKEEAAGKAEVGGGAPAAAKAQAVKYTGKIHPERGPMVDMDFARMSEEGIEALDRKFYIKGRKELYQW